jgi:transposase InsO family protein
MEDMTYTTNPHLPRLRMEAAQLVLKQGWSTRQTARYTGFNQSTIVRWVRKASSSNRRIIPTESSRPHHHPRELSLAAVRAILSYRQKYRRCAEVLQYFLQRDGIHVSLSSVKRTLKREGLVYPSKWKKWHVYPERPKPEKPGVLVEIDTIHDGSSENRLYVYTLLDVCSRWSYATACERITTHRSSRFVQTAQENAPFTFQCLQSDHGPEFSVGFTKQCTSHGLAHRHSRVRTPNDNAHLERFNRTLQDECLSRCARSLRSWKLSIPEYLHYYNTERPHMALNMKTPLEVMQSY